MMNIPAAGLERDKIIAAIKGWTVIGDACRKCQDGLICDIPDPETDCFEDACPQWSRERCAAFELWDELPGPKHYAENGLGEHVLAWVQDTIQRTVSGESFADVVSQAWIKWKKSLKGE